MTEAISLASADWRYYLTQGLLWNALQQPVRAIGAFEQACAIRPDSPDAWTGLAGAFHSIGSLPEAVSAYRNAHELAPQNIEVLNNLGVALDSSGQHSAAIDCFRQGLRLRPDFLPLYNNLGNTLVNLHRADEAIAILGEALQLDPRSADLWYNYGTALAAKSASLEAIRAFQRALEIAPGNLKALVNLANTFRARGDLVAAVACYNQAIAQDPAYYDAYNNVGVALLRMGQVDSAIGALTKAGTLNPNSSVAYNNLGNALKDAGRLDAAIAAYRRAVDLAPLDAQPHGNLVYSFAFHPDYDEGAILREAKQWARIHTKHLAKRAHPGHNADPERRLRIGYVSPDFRNHCQSFFTMPLFSNHDHAGFEIFCYAELACPDSISDRLAAYCDVWRPTCGLSDDAAATLIADDKIDILVDLSMHMSNGRPLLFARKPAPIQVAWLAYPGTTGQTAIDYRLTDPWLDPLEMGDARYTERSIRLPATFWCYDPLTSDTPVSALPTSTAGHITFGCLNNFCKVSDYSMEVWAQVMSMVPMSSMILLAPPGGHRARVHEIFDRYGIASERIEFVAFQPRDQYLKTYERIDICLDTLPYNGHTTSLDAYWMGVPVITQVGRTVVGRAGWSQLNNLGLRQLAAFDEQDFIRIAVDLAGDLSTLASLRCTLRSRLQTSPLMDGKRFAQAIESAYRQIWREWCLSSNSREV